MGKDLVLTGVRYNWATSIFYIIYMFVEVPSNILLKIIGPRYYLPLLVVGFGLVSLCTAFVKDFKDLMVARAFLGIFEGGVMPGIAFFISCFYKREELYLRIGIYVSGASLAGAFGGLLATVYVIHRQVCRSRSSIQIGPNSSVGYGIRPNPYVAKHLLL